MIINSTPEARVYVSTDDPRGMRKVVTTQFDKTSDTSLENITELSIDVEAGKTYYVNALLFTLLNAGNNMFKVDGTAVISSMRVMVYNYITATAVVLSSLEDLFYSHEIIGLSGTISFSAAGTLTLQFAQTTSSSSTSSVLVGSYMELREVI